MALDFLAVLATLTIASSEITSPRHFRVSFFLFLISMALLWASFRRCYFIISGMLALCVGAFYCIVPALRRTSATGSNGTTTTIGNTPGYLEQIVHGTFDWVYSFLSTTIPSVLAGFYHLIGVWVLPFVIAWGWSEASTDTVFFSQEVGHLVPATFYYVALVLMPLFLMPRGFERLDLAHQFYESAFIASVSIAYFLVFRLAHHYGEHADPPKMSAPNWDHEFLGLVWSGCGVAGILFARSGIKTSIHIAFPALFVCYSMLTHSNTHHQNMAEITDEDRWKLSWMKLHQIHGICFGIGGICRLLYKPTEAVFFFFLGSFVFVFSAMWIVQALYEALDWPEDPESEEFGGHYPTDHVMALLVVTVGTVLFPLNLAALGQLREFVETDKCVGGGESHDFEALPTVDDAEENSDEEEGRAGLSNGSMGQPNGFKM